jgi:hypothetical protein
MFYSGIQIQGANVGTISCVFGEFVHLEVQCPSMSPEDAEIIAQALILAAAVVRSRRVEPLTGLLPLSEPFRLESSLGDSCDRDAAPGNRCGETISAGK